MTATITQPVPVIGWDSTRAQWLKARTGGLGASDVAAILGFSKWHTPWQVWAEKTGTHRPDDTPSEAADLGNELEPWLLNKAATSLGRPVGRTPHKTYAHPEHQWRMASPDATSGPDLIEAKTAGLAGGFGVPEGWTADTVPLGYELQARWQMHVLGRDRVWIVALIANLGFRMYPIDRDVAIENDMVTQVDEWWQRHIVAGEEPPLGAGDADVIKSMYPSATGGQVDLDDTDAAVLLMRYREARDTESAGKKAKEEAGTAIKALLGDNSTGRIDGREAVTWLDQDNGTDWRTYAVDMAAANGLELPDPEPYRRPRKRTLKVKDLI